MVLKICMTSFKFLGQSFQRFYEKQCEIVTIFKDPYFEILF